MLTLITPCYRQKNLSKMHGSIRFDLIDKWIIVYDTTYDRRYEKIYTDNPKILEVECSGGISGNPQRNYGLNLVEDGHIYFLDDDNIIHPNFWFVATRLAADYFYTFDQLRDNKAEVLPGFNIAVDQIDTAMFIVHKNHVKNIQWCTDKYNADGYFICDINNQNKKAHIYINIVACYYNYIIT